MNVPFTADYFDGTVVVGGFRWQRVSIRVERVVVVGIGLIDWLRGRCTKRSLLRGSEAVS